MSVPKGYSINRRQVVHELIEGEVLAINLDTGTYYSLPGISSTIWGWLIEGTSVGAIVQALTKHYVGNPALVATEVDKFLERLVEEQLVVSDHTLTKLHSLYLEPIEGERPPFATPILEVYSDMQDLLLLDPIHDTDEAGWPVQKPLG